MTMPPLPSWPSGRDQVALCLARGPLSGATRWRLIPACASGQVAFGRYAQTDQAPTFTPRAVSVVTLRGMQIEEITDFSIPAALRRLALPDTIPG
jgi:hypothetical protein